MDKITNLIFLMGSDSLKSEIEKILSKGDLPHIFVDSKDQLVDLDFGKTPSIIFVDSSIKNQNIKEIPDKIKVKTGFKPIFVILINVEEIKLTHEFISSGYDDFLVLPIDKTVFFKTKEILTRLSTAESALSRAVQYIKTEDKSQTNLKNISNDIIIQWGRLENLGKLTSGIMHEIATPIQYLSDNLTFFKDNISPLIEAAEKSSDLIESIRKGNLNRDLLLKTEKAIMDCDLNYIKDEIPDAINQSIKGIEKITEIVLSVRTVSREISTKMTPSDINRIIKDAAIITKNIWKNVAELKLVLEENLPEIPCQPGAISQVIVNMIINSVHAIEENTENRKNLIKIETKLDKKDLIIKISDTGKGIPEDIIKKIFNPFFTTKKLDKGTGQGMAISKAIIEKHKGNILVSSNPGSGTVFSIKIPVNGEFIEKKDEKTEEKFLNTISSDSKASILFVVGDEEIFKSFGRILKPHEDEWEIQFADSSEKAIEIMNEKAADIVVTESDIKGINAHELLKIIMEKFPDTDRIVLSGETDEKKIMESISTAHQFITKPVSLSKLEAVFKRSIAMKNILKDRGMRGAISKIDSLPPTPAIYNEIIEELNSPVSSTKKIGRIIAQDPSMASKILQIVNSGFFYLPSKISRPEEAVVLLGVDIIKSLILNFELFSKFKLGKKYLPFQKKIYIHAMLTAKTAKEMVLMENLSPSDADQAFMAGLIHDCGKLLLASIFDEEYLKLINNEEYGTSNAMSFEKRSFKVSHDAAGAFLMGSWGMPIEIIEAILYHHTPAISSDKEFGITTAVYAANITAAAKTNSLGLPYEDAFDMDFMEKIKFADRIKIWRDKFLS